MGDRHLAFDMLAMRIPYRPTIWTDVIHDANSPYGLLYVTRKIINGSFRYKNFRFRLDSVYPELLQPSIGIICLGVNYNTHHALGITKFPYLIASTSYTLLTISSLVSHDCTMANIKYWNTRTSFN